MIFYIRKPLRSVNPKKHKSWKCVFASYNQYYKEVSVLKSICVIICGTLLFLNASKSVMGI